MPTKDSKYNPWWAAVVFDEFCAHYFAMSDEEKIQDLNKTMEALLKKDETGNSFGSKMVATAKERIATNREKKGVHGIQGGRPPKNQTPNTVNERCPKNKQEFDNFIYDNNLHIQFAKDWLEFHKKNNWCFIDGKPIDNWKGAVTKWCEAREQKVNGGENNEQ